MDHGEGGFHHGGRGRKLIGGSCPNIACLPSKNIIHSAKVAELVAIHLERYRESGGRVEMEMFEASGHGPLFDAVDRWKELFFGFLASVEEGGRES